jgi:hypothetical protein
VVAKPGLPAVLTDAARLRSRRPVQACGDGRVLLAYLDETSSPNRYYLGALIVHEPAAQPLTAALDKIMSESGPIASAGE